MSRESITNKQGIATMVMFIIGSTIILGAGRQGMQDVWISILISMAIALPILFIYSMIIKLFPGKNLYEISEVVFGKFFGKIVTLLFTWYSLHLGALVIRNFSEYIKIVSMPETP